MPKSHEIFICLFFSSFHFESDFVLFLRIFYYFFKCIFFDGTYFRFFFGTKVHNSAFPPRVQFALLFASPPGAAPQDWSSPRPSLRPRPSFKMVCPPVTTDCGLQKFCFFLKVPTSHNRAKVRIHGPPEGLVRLWPKNTRSPQTKYVLSPCTTSSIGIKSASISWGQKYEPNQRSSAWL